MTDERTARVIEALGITATATYGAREIPDDFRDSDPWTVVLRRGDTKQRMTVPFYMGRGHNGKEPTAHDVLNCLTADAATTENALQKMQSQTRRLKLFLGDYYEYALWGEDDPDEDDK